MSMNSNMLTQASSPKLHSDVEIVDVGPRDGLQSDAVTLPTAIKIELIQRLLDAGVRAVEVASFVNPKRVPQMADAEAVVSGLSKRKDTRYIGLVLNRMGFDRALQAGCRDISMVTSATDEFGVRNQGASTSESLAVWRAIAPLARAAGMRAEVTISVAFGCPFSGEAPVQQVVDIAQQIAREEPVAIVLADTIGVATPKQVTELFARVRAATPTHIALRAHFHNTRNTAIANAQAAFDAGVRSFDASVGGIGGCPFAPNATGNVASEDLVYLFERSGCRTGIALDKMIATSQWLGKLLNKAMPSMVARAGAWPR